MEKDHIEEYEYLYTYYSLFSWEQCSKCKKDFRREKMWRALTGPWVGGTGVNRFLCNKCASTREEASEFFTNKNFIPDRPPPPPPPPYKHNISKEKE